MKKSNASKRNMSPFIAAFLAVALVFLAVGFGTLGSFRSAGEDYELKAPVSSEGGDQRSTVVFKLTPSVSETYTDENGKEATRTVSLLIDDVYLYLNAIYSPAGVPAGISLRRGMTDKYMSDQKIATFENIYTAETEGEEDSDRPDASDALYNWVHPFVFNTHWSVSSYPYVEIYATSADIRLAEIVFVGQPQGEANSERYVIPASVYSATPDTGETGAQAAAKAAALVDSDVNEQARAYNAAADKHAAVLPSVPAPAVTSYERFTKAEVYSLLTITEMRAGGRYTVNNAGIDNKIYNLDRVNNALGVDLLALGTAMFGMSPFGLRFFPMLFSFGVLVAGWFFVRQLTKSDRAAFVFSVIYALCNLSFAYGHLGTPLTAGVFFLVLSALLVHKFYTKGMKKPSFASALPLIFAGLAGAAAICVNGAMLIPQLCVAGLFAAGMVRQQKAKRYYLDKAIAEAESAPAERADKAKKSAAKVAQDYRYKNVAAVLSYCGALILGAVLFSLLFMLPVYPAYVKMYDDPASPTLNLFSLGWTAFAGGFGKNVYGGGSAWNFILVFFKGAGESYAVTAAIVNFVALAMGAIGVVFAVCKTAACARNFKENGKQLRRVLVPLAGLAASLITASFAGAALPFLFLAYLFAFMLAAQAAEEAMCLEGSKGKAAKAVSVAGLVLLVVCFALFAAFTFSVPLPAGLIGKFF